MGEVGMAWRCLPSSRNEEVSACTPTEKRRGGKERGRRRVRHRKDRERKREREKGGGGGFSRTPGAGTDLVGSRESVCEEPSTEDLVRETGGPQDSKKEET